MATLLVGACGTNVPSASQPSTASQPSVEAIPIRSATPTPQPAIDDSTNNSSTTATESTDTQSTDTEQPEPQPETVMADEPSPCTVQPHLDFVGFPAYETLRDLMGCAIAEPSFDPVAINEFGEGPAFDRFMLWTSIDTMIYVLRPDGLWEMHLDSWSEDQPELMCNPFENDFTSPPLPRRGFGKLWCERSGLAETMGTITKEERLCQHSVIQQFEQGQLLACFEDATYHYFRIMHDQTWESVFIR